MNRRVSTIIVVIVLIIVVLFGVGQFFAYSNPSTSSSTGQNQTSTSTTNPTAVITFVPTVASGTPVESGSCFANSVAAPYRADAWRCIVGNAISDPCFVIPSSTNQLLCGTNPSNAEATSSFVLRVSKPLPTSNEMPSSTPANWSWLVELADGTTCSPYTGTRPFSAGGDVATYACDGPSSTEAMIFGDLNNSGQTWTAEVGALSNSTSTFPPPVTASSVVPVAVVWQ